MSALTVRQEGGVLVVPVTDTVRQEGGVLVVPVTDTVLPAAAGGRGAGGARQ